MVKTVWGFVENKAVSFTLSEDGFWKASVPAMESGEYVVALYCRDVAGNESYFGTILYAVDVEKMTCEIKMIDYCADGCFPDKGFHVASVRLCERIAEGNFSETEYQVAAAAFREDEEGSYADHE